jgi:hypothetical protein
VASPDDQRAGGQVESVVWSRTRSASVMALSEALTDHYRQAHPEALGLPAK